MTDDRTIRLVVAEILSCLKEHHVDPLKCMVITSVAIGVLTGEIEPQAVSLTDPVTGLPLPLDILGPDVARKYRSH